jgi:hypothetical protein
MLNLNILKSLILTAVIFVVTGLVGSKVAAADELPDLELAPLEDRSGTPAQVKKLVPVRTAPLSSTLVGQSIPASESVKLPDWAVTALQTLNEQYDCNQDKGDSHQNRALTRAEFVISLNACLNQVNKSIAAEPLDPATKTDLATIEQLQAEFATELTALRGRVEKIEAKTASLEQQQFSPTTKLSGIAWVNFTGAFTNGSITAERSPAQGGNSPFIAPTRVNGVPTRVQRRDASPTVSLFTYFSKQFCLSIASNIVRHSKGAISTRTVGVAYRR